MLQNIIGRMAHNSMVCKKWYIAIETIFFGLVKNDMSGWLFIMSVIVAVLFMYLDAGYLYFERQFRNQQKDFIDKINRGESFENDIFVVQPMDNNLRSITKTACSKYVWTYYFSIIIFTLIFTIYNN